ncbi:MAG: ABC transporter permease [Steroidobacteraceae bacterium]
MISLRRIRLVAARDFLVTVSSKGFLIGVLVMPAIMVALIAVLPRMIGQRGAPVNVEVALLDTSASLAGSLGEELTPGAITERRDAGRRRAAEELGPAGERAVNAVPDLAIPGFAVRELPRDAAIEEQKAWLAEKAAGDRDRRALVVVPADAVTRTADGPYGSYELYTPRNLPEEAENILHAAIRQALIAERLRESGFDAALVRAATQVARPRTVVVAGDGKQEGSTGLNRLLPFIMGILMFMFVMMSGQALMTSTVEEKSSRVVEVLLAAVSPLELMWGKLLGQLGVGLVTMAVYVALGLLALLQFAMLGLFDPLLILYLFLFFLTAYLVFGALMLAIGAAVNQMADAQSLMGPIMVLMVVPYILTPVIGREPDSALAVITSFVPPINGFAMLARLASASPPPFWQVLLSLLSGLVGAALAVWFASKVFRVGLLMHGKPPSFATLVKWARMG